MTADTAHVLADASTSRELAYVGLTRGREENRQYVETEETQPMSEVLESIAGHSDGILSAHESIRAEQARVDDPTTLFDQYGDVATALSAERAVPRVPATRTSLDVMREANRAKAQKQQEAQRKAGLNVRGTAKTRGDQRAPQREDPRTRGDDRKRWLIVRYRAVG